MLVAGAGTGKTKTLIHRCATMIKSGISPINILMVTFTNKAATEMRERLREMVGDSASHITAGTFHSVVYREMLSRYPDSSYLAEQGIDMANVGIMSDADSRKLLKESFEELGLPAKAYCDEHSIGLSDLDSQMGWARSRGYSLAEYRYQRVSGNEEVNPDFALVVEELWELYSQKCRAAGGIDFDDVLVVCAHMLEREPTIADSLGQRFRYLMLDEYQDTNPVQMRIMDAIARQHRNLFVVGDEKQSIYAFRGSDIQVIIGFLGRYQDAQIINMIRNYRSAPPVIECANAIAAAMNQRVPNSDGQLLAEAKIEPTPVSYYEFGNDLREASFIAGGIAKRLKAGVTGKNIAVLYRSRPIKQELERQLIAQGIPYLLEGDTAFFQRAEVRDTVALLRFVFQPWDNMAALRVLGSVSLGVSVNKVNAGLGQDSTVYEFLQAESDKRLKTTKAGIAPRTAAAKKVRAFLDVVDRTRECYEHFDDAEVLVKFVAEIWRIFFLPRVESAAKRATASQAQESVDLRKQNVGFVLEQFQEALGRGLTAEQAIEDLVLMAQASPDMDEEQDGKVRLMTMHASKGLEYDYLYVMGADSESLSAKEAEHFNDIEENRRLFYVAVTRAKRELCVTWSCQRLQHGQTLSTEQSPFVAEVLQHTGAGVVRG